VGDTNGLIILDRATQMLAEVRSVDDARDLIDLAEAARVYARKVKLGLDAQNHAAEIRLRAQRRAGEILLDMEKNTGAMGSGSNQFEVRLQPATAPQTYSDLGIDKRDAHIWLDLAPADIALSSVELVLVSRLGREAVLKRILARAGYEIVIVDCPPALGLLTVNALAAANGVIAPVLPAAADIRGLNLFLETLTTIREDINPTLQLVGVILVQFDGRLNSHNQALEALQSADIPLLMPPVPRSVRVQEAAGVMQPLSAYDPSGKPINAYQAITTEVLAWLDKTLVS